MSAIALRERLRWSTAVFFILAGILAASWSSRIPDIQQHLGLNNTAWGTVLFALPMGFIAGLAVASWLATRFGTHTIMVVGSLLASILLVLLGKAQNVFQLMSILFGVGFVRTVFNISINTRSVEIQKLYDKPVVSLFHGLWSLSCLVAAGIGTAMIIWHFSPATHFLGVAIVCIAITLLFRKNPQPQANTELGKRPFLVKPDRYLLLLGLIAFCVMLCESTVFDWSVNYYEKVVKAGEGRTTFGYTGFIIMMATGRLFGDRLIRLFGAINLLKINSILLVFGFIIVACFPNIWAATTGFLLIGLGDSVIVPITYNLSAQTQKMPPSYALSAVTLIGYVGFLAGPILVGYISDAMGMQWAMGLVGITCIAIFFLTDLVAKKFTSADKKK